MYNYQCTVLPKKYDRNYENQVRYDGVNWCVPVIPPLKRQRQEESETSLVYIVRPYSKTQRLQIEASGKVHSCNVLESLFLRLILEKSYELHVHLYLCVLSDSCFQTLIAF